MIRCSIDPQYLKPSYSYSLDFLQGDTKVHRIGECKVCFDLVFYSESKKIIGQIPFSDIRIDDGRHCKHELGKGSTMRIIGLLEPHEAVIGLLCMDTSHYTVAKFKHSLMTATGSMSAGIS